MTIIHFLVFCLLTAAYTGVESTSIERNEYNRFSELTIFPQLFEMLRMIILNGDEKTNTPPSDPYEIGDMHIDSKLIGLSFELQTDAYLEGFGSFQTPYFLFNKSEISIDVKIYFPLLTLAVSSVIIPDLKPILIEKDVIYDVHNLTCWANIYLMQSENGDSVLIKKLDRPGFNIQRISRKIKDASDLDLIIDRLVDHIRQYLNRFNTGISFLRNQHFIQWINPLLNKLDSWRILSLLLK